MRDSTHKDNLNCNRFWGKLEKMDTKVYDERQTEVSEWKGFHTASTLRSCA